jgi:hypothetical protein
MNDRSLAGSDSDWHHIVWMIVIGTLGGNIDCGVCEEVERPSVCKLCDFQENVVVVLITGL